jgi:hypothetical protein
LSWLRGGTSSRASGERAVAEPAGRPLVSPDLHQPEGETDEL